MQPWTRATLKDVEPELETLSPEAREAVERLAAESGLPFSEALSLLVIRGANGTAGEGNPAEQEAAWEAFLAATADWSKSLPEGTVVDDSRESIYAGRGE